MTLPDWHELRERMLAPKPAIRFTAYAIGRDPLKIHYDGQGRDGGPTCATVRLPDGAWQVKKGR